jgi:lipopolysaccharide biosynthesis regulator YciM
MPCRSLFVRLKERHLSIEKIATELSKAKSLNADTKTMAAVLTKALRANPFYASIVLAAVEMDENVVNGLVPPEIGDAKTVSKKFGEVLLSKQTPISVAYSSDYDVVNLQPFLKQALVHIAKAALSEKID